MKKQKKAKILKLNLETLRQLDDKDNYLKIVGGVGSQNFGGGAQCVPSAPTACFC
jgi:hypothetical protein